MARFVIGRLATFVAVLVCAALPAMADDDVSTATVAVEKEVLKVSIALPKRFDKRTVSINGSEQFHVVVTNVSDAPVRLWRDWCSWGYYNLSFELQFGDEKPLQLLKEPRDWDKNYPDFLELPPGEHLVLGVQLDPGAWKVPFEKLAEPRAARLRAVYAIEADDDSRKSAVWSGRVESSAVEVMLHDQR